MVTVNGKRVVRSVPARILRKVLEEHATTGRTELEYWELLSDQATIPNQEHHHLSRLWSDWRRHWGGKPAYSSSHVRAATGRPRDRFPRGVAGRFESRGYHSFS